MYPDVSSTKRDLSCIIGVQQLCERVYVTWWLCGVVFCPSSVIFAVLFVGILRCCVKAKVVVERVVLFCHYSTTSAHLLRLHSVCFYSWLRVRGDSSRFNRTSCLRNYKINIFCRCCTTFWTTGLSPSCVKAFQICLNVLNMHSS